MLPALDKACERYTPIQIALVVVRPYIICALSIRHRQARDWGFRQKPLNSTQFNLLSSYNHHYLRFLSTLVLFLLHPLSLFLSLPFFLLLIVSNAVVMSNPIHSNPAGINSRQQGQSPNPSHPRSHERRLSSNNPFRSEYNDNAYPEGQSSLSPRHPQHPQPAAIRAVNSSASHYNNSTSPQFSSPYPNANAVYRPPSYVGSGVPSIIGTDPHDNYNPNLHPTFENDSKPYPASDMSSIDSLARSPRPTSEVFNNISQKQRQISFAIYEGEEINLSDPNLNYANGPGFLSTPNDSQTDVSATQDLQRDPTIMKRTRWGTQRNKKGRPPKRSKSNKSVLSRDTAQNRISSAGSATSNNGGSPSHLGDASINDQASDTPNGAGNGTHRVYINMKLPEDMIDPETGLPIIAYPRNKIRTTKYTPLSFLPKNLFYQFQNIANVYFLFIVILGVSISISFIWCSLIFFIHTWSFVLTF